MKKYLGFVSVVWLSFNSLAADVWVSDEIEAPLRSAPELNSKIVKLLPAGQAVTLLEEKQDYVKIKTRDGQEGWLSNYYVLRNQSVHAKLAPTEQSLAQKTAEVNKLNEQIKAKNKEIAELKASIDSAKNTATEVEKRAKDSEVGLSKVSKDNKLLQKELAEQNTKITQLATALDAAKKKATDARARYLSLAKVSQNAVEIDDQNRSLQEKAVKFEQEIQQLKTENQTLQSKIGKKEFVIGALTILGGILVGYVLSVMMPPRGRRTSRYSSSL